MSKNHHINVFDFLKWIAGYYLQLEKKTIPYPCKLGRFENNSFLCIKQNKLIVRVEFSGQINILDLQLNELMEAELFEYFSPQDKKKLFKEYLNQERYRLSNTYFCKDKQTDLIVLEDRYTGSKKTWEASEIQKDAGMLNNLSKKDISKITFLAASSYFKKIFSR